MLLLQLWLSADKVLKYEGVVSDDDEWMGFTYVKTILSLVLH